MFRRFAASLLLAGGIYAVQPSPVANAQTFSCVDAVDDSYVTPFNTPIDITDVQLLSNDTASPQCELSHDNLYIEAWTNPSNGTLSHLSGTFTYTPNDGFVGVDTFTYQACFFYDYARIEESDSEEESYNCDWATVSIDPQNQVTTTTTATVLASTIANPTTTPTVLAEELANTGSNTSTTLPIAGLLTGTGALLIGSAAIYRRRLLGNKNK